VIYILKASRQAGVGLECYSPENDVWAGDHSTIEDRQTIVVPLNLTQPITSNIPVKYQRTAHIRILDVSSYCC